jgi:hypothetical protein
VFQIDATDEAEPDRRTQEPCPRRVFSGLLIHLAAWTGSFHANAGSLFERLAVSADTGKVVASLPCVGVNSDMSFDVESEIVNLDDESSTARSTVSIVLAETGVLERNGDQPLIETGTNRQTVRLECVLPLKIRHTNLD